MRLSIKAKKAEELLDKIQFFFSNRIEQWQCLSDSENKMVITPLEKELFNNTSIFFYIKLLGNKKYIRAEFTNNSNDKKLNNRVLGNLVELFFNHFNEDIIRLSILKKKKQIL